EDDYLLVRVLILQAVDQVHLGADGPLRARRGLTHLIDDVGGGAGYVGLLHNLPLALGVDDHLQPRIPGTDLVHMFRPEEGMDRSMTLPKTEVGLAQGTLIVAAQIPYRIPDHHLLERIAHRMGRVAAEEL